MPTIQERRNQPPLPPISTARMMTPTTSIFAPFIDTPIFRTTPLTAGTSSSSTSSSVVPFTSGRRRTADLLETSATLINMSIQALLSGRLFPEFPVIRSTAEPSHRIRLDYVTDRILTMVFPSLEEEESYRSGLGDVALNLKNKFGDNYKVLNLSQRRTDLAEQHNHVIEYGWPEDLAPPIRFLRAMCHEVRSWLAVSDRHVIILHCKGGLGRLATLIAAYMYYCMTRGRIDRSVLADQGALKQYYEERLNTTCLPSQRRYVQYFSSLLSGGLSLTENSVELHNVCLIGFPRLDFSHAGEGHVQLKIYQNMRLRRVTPTLRVRYAVERLILEVEPPLLLNGDILVKCFYRRDKESPRETVFRLQFHTCSIHTDQVSFYKQELDAACIDFRYPANGRVELNFKRNDSLHNESTKGFIAGQLAFEKPGEVPTFVHYDSYEDLCLPALPSATNFSPDIDSGSQLHGPMDQRQSTRLSAISHTGGPTECQPLAPLQPHFIPASTGEVIEKKVIKSEESSRTAAMNAGQDANELDRLLEELKVVGESQRTTHRQHQTYTRQEQSYTQPQPPQQQQQYSTTVTRTYNGPQTVVVNASSHRPSTASSSSAHQEQVLIEELRSAQDRLNSLRRAQSADGGAKEENHGGWQESIVRKEVEGSGGEQEAFDISLRYTSLPSSSSSRVHRSQQVTHQRAISPGHYDASEMSQGLRYRSASTDRYTPAAHGNSSHWSESKTFSTSASRGGPRSMSVEPNRFPVENSHTLRSQSHEMVDGHFYGPHGTMETVEIQREEPYMNSYSAHRENLRLQQQYETQNQPQHQYQRTVQRTYQQQQSSRGGSDSGPEVVEEVETVTLQPIGKGVRDLDPMRPTTPGGVWRYGKFFALRRVPSAPIGSRTPTLSRAGDMTLMGQQQNQHITQRTTSYQHSAQVHQGAHSDYFGRGRSPGPIRQQSSSYEYQQESGLTPGFGHSRTNSNSSMDGFGAATTMDGMSISGSQTAPRFVKDTSCYWYKPTIGREEAISILRDKAPGTFVVRDSNSYPGAYGLAVKVAQLPAGVTPKSDDLQSELVRHFLIEPTMKGVRLKGCPNEPVFGSLAALVYQHTLTPLALPCRLLIPDQDLFSGPSSGGMSSVDGPSSPSDIFQRGAACNVLYMGSVDVEAMTGSNAVGRAVDIVINQMNAGKQTTDVHFKASNDGITLTDNLRKLFFRRHYQLNLISYCGLDPKDRVWDSAELRSRGIQQSRIFAFVSRRQGSTSENVCHVFSEVESTQPATAIVKFVNKYLLSQ